MKKQFAVSRLHLADGTVLHNQVIMVSSDGETHFHELNEEEPFTEWRGGDFYIKKKI